MVRTTRALRNNNPGALIRGKKPFLGEVEVSTDPRYRQFETMDYGYRALLKVLLNYIHAGDNTIRRLIMRYDLKEKNTVDENIDIISKRIGINCNDVVEISREKIVTIAETISSIINGDLPDTEVISRAWEILMTKTTN